MDRLNNKTIEIIRELDLFFRDPKKTDTWLRTENPLLGGMKPWDMIEAGREEKLLKVIKDQLSENENKK